MTKIWTKSDKNIGKSGKNMDKVTSWGTVRTPTKVREKIPKMRETNGKRRAEQSKKRAKERRKVRERIPKMRETNGKESRIIKKESEEGEGEDYIQEREERK
jgi:hypothetical protein